MIYVVLGYALTFAAADLPKILSDTPAESAQVATQAEETPATPAATRGPTATAPAEGSDSTSGAVAVHDPEQGTEEVDLEIERAARDFRIATYENFRLDRDTYERHIAAGHDAHRQWRQNPGTETERAELLDWFARAESHAQQAQAEPPALPGFLAGEVETLALGDEESSSPDAAPIEVVVEFDAPVAAAESTEEQSLLPPTASATPLPPVEMTEPAPLPSEQPAAPADPLAALEELSWSAEDWSADGLSYDLAFESELSQSVAQYNRDVVALVTQLSGDEPWRADNLEPIAMQLADLAAQRQILTLRAQLQQAELGELLSLEPALNRFAERLEEARRHAENQAGDFPRGAEMQRVKALEATHARLEAEN